MTLASSSHQPLWPQSHEFLEENHITNHSWDISINTLEKKETKTTSLVRLVRKKTHTHFVSVMFSPCFLVPFSFQPKVTFQEEVIQNRKIPGYLDFPPKRLGESEKTFQSPSSGGSNRGGFWQTSHGWMGTPFQCSQFPLNHDYREYIQNHTLKKQTNFVDLKLISDFDTPMF